MIKLWCETASTFKINIMIFVFAGKSLKIIKVVVIITLFLIGGDAYNLYLKFKIWRCYKKFSSEKTFGKIFIFLGSPMQVGVTISNEL